MPARYTAVGVFCALLNNAIIITGSMFGLHYSIMTIAAALVSTPIAYLLHAGFTFRQPLSGLGFLRYAATLLTGMAAFFALMFVFCTLLHVPVAIASPGATVLLFIWNYCSAHWAIARR